jgi:hypothetical protein
MGPFEWLENTPIALWVGESLWAYPFMLSLHVVGLAILVGVFTMLNLRLLGSFKEIRIDSFLPVMKFAWVGFVVNAISGTFLFTSQATVFVTNTPFLLKISMIFVGAILAAIIQSRLRDARDATTGDWTISGGTKAVAALSLAMWMGAIVTGRLVAYF